MKRVSSLHRHSLKPVNYVVGDPRDAQGPPQIAYTPATPLTTKDAATSRLGYHTVKNSLDSEYKYHGATMGVVDEESRAEIASKSSTIVGPEPVPRPSYKKMSTSVRSKKHGSFDFEKPGWVASQIQRNGSNDSEWSKNSESIHKERDSTYGPGLAGVGTLQRDVSVKRAQEREEKNRLRDVTRKQTVPAAKSTNPTPHISSNSDHVHNSTSTTGKSNTGTEKSLPTTGKSSSMSKASGKRALHATKTRSGSGVARFIGLTTQHGPFSFEPAVPSTNRSTGSNGAGHEVLPSRSKTEKEKARLRDEMERQQSKDRKRGDRPAVPVPMTSTNAGHRSGTKGRSLDLGLGLAWAPSKVREEALLPSSTFFARSISNSSSKRSRSESTTTGASSSTTGNGSGRSKGGVINQDHVERSKLGREVAELFKHAVEPEGYKAFRNCEFLFFEEPCLLTLFFFKTCTNSMHMKYHLTDLRGSLRVSNDFWILLLDLELKQNNIYWINSSGLSCNRHSQQDRFPPWFPHSHISTAFF